ncbi:MAG: F-type H+-transporting ATPase subunit b [Frankiaceae bacterium]|jgi:F-type H+-transporting ATPase subunit b|nr:F-type H+-transporting ATPase subunit b [Frankiaceae bacterium]
MAAPLALRALQAVAEGVEKQPSPLAPKPAEIIVGVVAFALLFFFMRAKVWPNFEKAFRDRAEAIEGGISKAEKAQAEAAALKADFERQLAQSRSDAAQQREAARAEGQQIVEEMRAKAQAEAERIVTAAHEQIASDRAAAAASLRSEIGTLAVQLASRIVGESLEDQARQSRVVDRFLEEIDATAGQAR